MYSGKIPLRAPAHGKRAMARALRKNPTPAESMAWELLRARRMLGLKFRRQHVVYGYIVDFYCAQHGLILELDGAVHDDPDHALRDAQRTSALTERGFTVIRMRNGDVSAESLRKRIETAIDVM